MAKYIIRLERGETAYKTVNLNGNPLIELLAPMPYTEPDLEQVRKEAFEKGYSTAVAEQECAVRGAAEKGYQKGYETGYKDGYHEPGKNQQEAYQRGLNDAWGCMKEITHIVRDQGTMIDLFGCRAFGALLEKYTPGECIEKIRQYERDKEEKITKGDIVRIKSAPEIEILVTYADKRHVSGIALTEVDDCCEIGDLYTDIVIYKVEKTGRHYEIAEVLRKMKENSDG